MELDYFQNEKVDFESVLRRYGQENDMTFSKVLKFVSTRKSLCVAGELLGITTTRDVLTQLGSFLAAKGYMVPKLKDATADPIERRKSIAAISNKKAAAPNPGLVSNGSTRQSKKSSDTSGGKFHLTKEQYLHNRLAGKKRSAIARTQKVSDATLLYHLKKWGIKDPVVEEAAMEELRSKQKTVIQVAEQRPAVKSTPVDSVDKSVESVDNKPDTDPSSADTDGFREITFDSVKVRLSLAKKPDYVTLRIPLRKLDLPKQSLVAAGRTQIISDVFVAAQRAVGWIYQDLSELLGTDDVQEHAQQYFDRQLAELMKEALSE